MPPSWTDCFELGEPDEFRENELRELPLSETEIAALLHVGKQAKYLAARNAWYRWKIVQQGTPRAYTAAEVRTWFDHTAAQQLGPKKRFIVDESNEFVVQLLCLYFAEDPTFEQFKGPGGVPYSLEKGLLLRGGVGCGKTTLLTIFASNPRQPYLIVPARDLEDEYSEQGLPGQPAGGQQALRAYCRLTKLPLGYGAAYNYRTHAGLALDDIGTEDWRAKHYGKELAVVEHVISSRDDGVTAGTVPRHATHATTNVDFDDVPLAGGELIRGLEFRYGPRWRSRVRGLMNIIDFPDSAPDRRS